MSIYAKMYIQYKDRLRQRPCNLPPAKHKSRLKGKDDAEIKEELEPNGCTNGHMHNKALRYAVKQFFVDFYVAWREMRGLEVRPPYKEEYLGKVHNSERG